MYKDLIRSFPETLGNVGDVMLRSEERQLGRLVNWVELNLWSLVFFYTVLKILFIHRPVSDHGKTVLMKVKAG